MMSKQNVPELRFPEFSGEWEEKFIDNDFIIIDGDRGKNYPKEEDFLNDGYCLFLNAKNITKNGLNYDNLQFISKEKHSQLSKGSVKSGDVVITTRGTVGNVSYFNTLSPFEAIRINSGMLILRNPNVNDFYVSLFKSKVFKKFLKQITYQSAQPHITVSTLKKMKYFAPKITNEQKKIGVFLSKLDRLIELEEKKLELLEEQKKGYMQKIFSQELRFKDENGNDYPEWRDYYLKEVSERVTRKNSELSTERPLTISGELGLVDQVTYFSKSVSSKNLGNYILIKNGEFAYNKSYSKGYPFGAIKRLEKYKEGALSTLYICFKIKENHDSDFMKYYFESSEWHKEVSLIAVEGARNHGLLNIPISDFFNINLRLPSLKEQKKISEFLVLLDYKLNSQGLKIEYLKKRKQGLLTNMFM